MVETRRSSAGMTDPLSLEALLEALRQAGLPIGITEAIRLQRVFALRPGSADDRRLKSILRAILVKGDEDDAVFDRVVEAWLAGAASEVEARAQRPFEPVRRPARRPWQPPAFRRSWWSRRSARSSNTS
jgi:uncharacterized protein with von Willebrand factor type A (vWA) domain